MSELGTVAGPNAGSARPGIATRTEVVSVLPERAVQFGTGAFLRGFIDAFIDDANKRGQFMGRVVAVGSTGSGRDRAFDEQHGLYTLVVAGVVQGESVNERRIVSSVSRALSASDAWSDVLATARNANIRVVFSNTTEAGIALDPRDQERDAIRTNTVPFSFPAKLTAWLYERARTFRFDAAASVVVVPCELIEANGDRLGALVREQAKLWRLDAQFAHWLSDAVPFCNTLVDRIVPGMPDAVAYEQLAQQLGYDDALLTMAEPYALFAIEGDARLADRLEFVDVGRGGAIRVVPDVRPYRERKVHVLNGAHTAMAALGVLSGIATVHDAMTTPALAGFLQQLVRDEIVPMLDVPEAASFADAVLDRFANPYVQHRLTDIATQGTLKWRVRLLPMLERHANQALPKALTIALAAQLLLSHPDERARRTKPNLPTFADSGGDVVHAHWLSANALSAGATPIEGFVQTVLADASLWGRDLRTMPGLAPALSELLQRLRTDGAMSLLSSQLVTS